MIKVIVYVLLIFVTSSCNNMGQDKEVLSEEKMAQLLHIGDSVTGAVQNVLLQNVAGAIQQGGTEYAVSYCSEKALPLTNDIANKHEINIQRLSPKNRNNQNAMRNKTDSIAWEKLKNEQSHFILQDENGENIYYKPIVLAMPTCIKCHGNKSEISDETLKAITQKYPNDKAIDYNMGDLRGMWKVSEINKLLK